MLIVRTGISLVLSSIVVAGIANLWCGQKTPSVDKEIINFYSVFELTKPTGAQPTLRGARLANPKDWPASFYSVHPGGSCSSTLVGPRSLLTAAHCAPNEAAVAVSLGNQVYRGKCAQSSLYKPGSTIGESADWAMCLMEGAVPVLQYETINMDPARIKVGTELLLTGFGCTQQNGTGGNDGNYRIGEVKVSASPSGQNNYITTSGEVALCYGDSGGGAFIFLDYAKTKRVQVSVNSRIQVLDNGELGKDSSLSSLSTPTAQAFIKNWASANSAEVCGLTPNLQHCR